MITPTNLYKIEFVPMTKGRIRSVTISIESEKDGDEVQFEIEDLMREFFDQDMTVRMIGRLTGFKQVKDE